ncbi:efflux RND transporter periplasmic adaptor subunit [Legionella taurinensis]|nr:efflux RND transporter periplasmic adaptor subunit [Legionella taurinensis]MDX1838519.1 efflux RND transporter periplasmic adaptor subunit [Legionella taurinensis]
MLKIQWHRMVRSRYYWQKAALILLLATLGIFSIRALFHSKTSAEAPANKLVEIEVVKKQTLRQTIHLLGTIHPQHSTVLVAKESGMLDALVPTGQKIRKGTLIAKIANPDREKNLQLSTAAVELAKAQYERISPLIKKGYVSAKEAEEKKQLWIDAQKELSKTKIELDNSRFYAPFDGIIGAYKKREGAEVNAGEAVVSLYDPSSLIVDVDIPCSNLSDIHEGQPVYVQGKTYALSHLQKMLDEDTHMCPADVTIQCEECLVGSTVDVDLVVAEKKDTVVIPFQALFLRNSKPFVYVVRQSRIELVAVKTGLKQQDQIEIISGLKPGQHLVIRGQERLYPGMTVDSVNPSDAKASKPS